MWLLPGLQGCKRVLRACHEQFSQTIIVFPVVLQCILVYVQWMMLIVNLPISWMPWSSAASGSASDAGSSITGFLSWLLGIIFGRSASLDCYLQAQKALQGDKQQQIVSNVFLRAVGRCAAGAWRPLRECHKHMQHASHFSRH